jgi:hypothetical protein
MTCVHWPMSCRAFTPCRSAGAIGFVSQSDGCNQRSNAQWNHAGTKRSHLTLNSFSVAAFASAPHAHHRSRRSVNTGCGARTHRPLFFLASRTPIPAISSSVMNRMPAFSNAASIRITVET